MEFSKTIALPLLVIGFITVSATADDVKVNLGWYGFLLPTWTLSSAGVESFSQQNSGAYTAASNPVLQRSPDQARSTFQVAQSRFGFTLGPSRSARGRMEFDFIDFSKSSPTTAALPRVRRAVIEADLDNFTTIRFGQDWDLASPTNPITFNPIGNYFQAGNIGFMRIQGQVIHSSGNFEHAVALGLPGSNNNSVDSALELTVAPSIAIRETYRPSSNVRLGVSVLATTMRRDTASSKRIFAGFANVFYESTSEECEIRSEFYFGQNTFNVGSLGLGFGIAGAEAAKEAGAYFSGRYHFSEKAAIYGGIGAAFVLNPNEMAAAYSGTSLTNTGPGIERNFTMRAGGQWKPTAPLVAFIELAGLSTRHHLHPADTTLGKDRGAFLVQSGAMLSF